MKCQPGCRFGSHSRQFAKFVNQSRNRRGRPTRSGCLHRDSSYLYSVEIIGHLFDFTTQSAQISSTGRPLIPSAGPIKPSASICSIKRAARL